MKWRFVVLVARVYECAMLKEKVGYFHTSIDGRNVQRGEMEIL